MPNCFILGRGLRKFLAASSTTIESLPLKELDFGLQKPTGPSSGVVASIVLIIIALSFVFLHNSHTFQIVLEDTFTSNHFSGTFQNQNCCCLNNHKKSKLCQKVIIFISLERSCVTLSNEAMVILFPILLSSYLDFCEMSAKKKIIKKCDWL